MKLVFVGGFMGTSGYATHLRNLALSCKRQGDIVFVETQLPEGWEKIITDEENDVLTQPIDDVDKWNVAIHSPYHVSAKFREQGKLALFMVFEGDVAPKQWGEIGNRDEVRVVLTPSQHSKDALVKAGVKQEKIFIVPHGFDPKIFSPQVEPSPILASNDDCVFVWNKGWSKGEADRSGFADVLRAFSDEFKDEASVRLLAHINPAYNPQGWNVEAEIAKLGIIDIQSRKCKIVVNSSAMPSEDLARFYKAGNFFVGTSKADAFNIPVLEAMAMGLVPIISSFGGQMDYAKDVSYVVGGELVPATIGDFNDIPLYEQAKWLKLDQAQLRKAFRESFELWKNNREEYKKKSELCIKASQGWTWADSAKKLVEVLNKYG